MNPNDTRLISKEAMIEAECDVTEREARTIMQSESNDPHTDLITNGKQLTIVDKTTVELDENEPSGNPNDFYR